MFSRAYYGLWLSEEEGLELQPIQLMARPPPTLHIDPGVDRDVARRGLAKWDAVPGHNFPLPAAIGKGESWEPDHYIPMKCVQRAHDLYKEEITGKPAKSRMVADQAQNYNHAFRECKFRYRGVAPFAAQLAPGDKIAVVDISSFYLRLPLHRCLFRFHAYHDPFKPEGQRWRLCVRYTFGSLASPLYACSYSSEVMDSVLGAATLALARFRAKGGARMPARALALAAWALDPKYATYVDDNALGGSRTVLTPRLPRGQ